MHPGRLSANGSRIDHGISEEEVTGDLGKNSFLEFDWSQFKEVCPVELCLWATLGWNFVRNRQRLENAPAVGTGCRQVWR